MLLCYIAILGAIALPRLAAAGPNADAEIFVGEEGPFCGFAANSTVEFSVSARNMSGVRQVKSNLAGNQPTRSPRSRVR